MYESMQHKHIETKKLWRGHYVWWRDGNNKPFGRNKFLEKINAIYQIKMPRPMRQDGAIVMGRQIYSLTLPKGACERLDEKIRFGRGGISHI